MINDIQTQLYVRYQVPELMRTAEAQRLAHSIESTRTPAVRRLADTVGQMMIRLGERLRN